MKTLTHPVWLDSSLNGTANGRKEMLLGARCMNPWFDGVARRASNALMKSARLMVR